MIYKSLEPTLKRDSYIQISLVQKLKELMGEFINRKIIGSSQFLVHNAQLQNSLRKFYIKC